MNSVSSTTNEDKIIASLAEKSLTGKELLDLLRTFKPDFTKQALYQILRKLIAEETVVKHGKQFSLSRVWLSKMNHFFTRALDRYGVSGESGADFLLLSEGDKIRYSFKNPAEADKFWGHAFDVLAEKLEKREAIYIYNPHEWFFLARGESEIFLFDKLQKIKQALWLVSGHNTILDKYVRKFFDGKYLQYHMLDAPLFEKENYYINVFGDFIIEGRIDESVAKEIDNFYNQTSEWNESSEKRIKQIVSEGKTELTISRNSKKATKFKKTIEKYFFAVKEEK